ncbi:hypothetical protein FJV76_24220 [Mesorhizobium sp. WSM4303]|uniref:hypothetical protein n=1 Tax=unclassified Mesorhizobium TaxID=325217 RepID=UPI00115ED9B3|nr:MULTISPECIES: hypothetical protein [unclassified Mesorhizobium]TRC92046.1 hypothetical protein FJV77_26960 [Mesorhizobium sp. WSM4306]TRC99313.1 hypothetical protein FJV76_24220 [Mesorhizobium sp. WSM4303]
MALDFEDMGSRIISQATQIAGGSWKAMATAATVEFRGLAQRIALIVEAYANGELSQVRAKAHLKNARFHVIATLAMLTVMTEAALEKIVKGALAIVKESVNKAAGFALLL